MPSLNPLCLSKAFRPIIATLPGEQKTPCIFHPLACSTLPLFCDCVSSLTNHSSVFNGAASAPERKVHVCFLCTSHVMYQTDGCTNRQTDRQTARACAQWSCPSQLVENSTGPGFNPHWYPLPTLTLCIPG